MPSKPEIRSAQDFAVLGDAGIRSRDFVREITSSSGVGGTEWYAGAVCEMEGNHAGERIDESHYV